MRQSNLVAPVTRRLVSVREAAAILGLSHWTVWTRVLSGDWPSVKVGRSRRLELAFLDKVIAEGREVAGRRLPARGR